MKATNWEFTNRALVFGLIFGFTFPLYSLDHQNSTAALANWLGARLQIDADLVAHLLFAFAAFLLVVAALIRTWASSYLRAAVVYAAEVKTESLVADGPYRQVRNPLYFANVVMAIGMGAMMSRTGFFVVEVAMLVFCYRLILREEAELQASQGEQYEAYSKAVPRLWPSLWPRIASAERQARWTEGFKAESWYWGFAAALVAFAITLKLKLFFAILGASLTRVSVEVLSRTLPEPLVSKYAVTRAEPVSLPTAGTPIRRDTTSTPPIPRFRRMANRFSTKKGRTLARPYLSCQPPERFRFAPSRRLR